MNPVGANLVAATATIADAIAVIDRAGGAPIALVHEAGRLIGTVTDGDVRRGQLKGIGPEQPVTRIMNVRPVTAPAGTSARDAERIMRQRSIMQLPLVDRDGTPVGIHALADSDNVSAAAETLVVLMAGGRGTRLKPITEDVPKPMVEVGGKPILSTIVERFVAQAFTRIVLAVNYKREIIEDYFGDGAKFGARISYVREAQQMGTAGALSLLSEPARGPVIVMNGDLLARVNFHRLLKFHQEQAAAATMGVFEYKHTVPFGVVHFDGEAFGGIVEKPVHRYFASAGIYVLAPEVIAGIARDRPTDMPAVFERVKASGRPPAVFPLREYWIDVGQIDDLKQAERDFGSAFPQD